MKTCVPESEHHLALQRWEGGQAKVWLYHVSLRRLAIRVQTAAHDEALFLVATGCERITGPFVWGNACLRVSKGKDPATGEGYCVIADRAVGFELRCSTVSLATGSPYEVDASFDDCLGVQRGTE